MRRIPLALAALATVWLGTPSASAQEFRAGGGVGFPIEPSEFKDLYNIGFHGGLELGGRVGKAQRTSIGLAIYHHRFPLDTNGVVQRWRALGMPANTSYQIDGGTFVLTEVFGVVRQDVSDGDVRPYFLGGVGVAIVDVTSLDLRLDDKYSSTDPEAETDLMGTMGFGVDVPVGPVKLFGQVRMSLVFTEGDNTLLAPITVGVAL